MGQDNSTPPGIDSGASDDEVYRACLERHADWHRKGMFDLDVLRCDVEAYMRRCATGNRGGSLGAIGMVSRIIANGIRGAFEAGRYGLGKRPLVEKKENLRADSQPGHFATRYGRRRADHE